MNKDIFILRGLPGSGKSTLARALSYNFLGEAYVCSADHYMVDAEGQYVFDPSRLKECHSKCKEEFESILLSTRDNPMGVRVIVDNTNMAEEEYHWYLRTAEEINEEPSQHPGFKVHLLTVGNHHGGVSIHDVPPASMARMEARFENPLNA